MNSERRDKALDAVEYSDAEMGKLIDRLPKKWPSAEKLILELWMGRTHWNDIEVQLKSMVSAEVDRAESDRLLHAPQD